MQNNCVFYNHFLHLNIFQLLSISFIKAHQLLEYVVQPMGDLIISYPENRENSLRAWLTNIEVIIL